MAELDMRMPVVLSHGIPDSTTPGWVGLLAMDVTQASKPIYKCTAADKEKGVYTWRRLESGTGGGDAVQIDATLTKKGYAADAAAVGNALGKLPSNEYIVSVFEELKALIKAGNTDGAIAVLDEAILDLAVLA